MGPEGGLVRKIDRTRPQVPPEPPVELTELQEFKEFEELNELQEFKELDEFKEFKVIKELQRVQSNKRLEGLTRPQNKFQAQQGFARPQKHKHNRNQKLTPGLAITNQAKQKSKLESTPI